MHKIILYYPHCQQHALWFERILKRRHTSMTATVQRHYAILNYIA